MKVVGDCDVDVGTISVKHIPFFLPLHIGKGCHMQRQTLMGSPCGR